MYEFQLKVCFWGSNQQYSCIGSDNDLAPTKWHAIVWTNDGKSTDAYSIIQPQWVKTNDAQKALQDNSIQDTISVKQNGTPCRRDFVGVFNVALTDGA